MMALRDIALFLAGVFGGWSFAGMVALFDRDNNPDCWVDGYGKLLLTFIGLTAAWLLVWGVLR